MSNKKYIIIPIILLTVTSTSAISIQSWGYQLQNYDLTQLENATHDLLVLDYSKDGSHEERFTSDELAKIRNNSKIILSYLSIGEAEDYRYYFDDAWFENPPMWMDSENPNWEGNYKVQYWNTNWQQIIFDYLDVIISQGFAGVYLDIIDAYEYYEDQIDNAADLMVDFVVGIANYARNMTNEFLIFPQNGEELLKIDRYRNKIDGIGKEDTYVLPDEQIKRDSDEIDLIESNLDLLINDGKTVLTVDYTDDPNLIEFTRVSAVEKNYIPYIAPLDLDNLYQLNYSGTDNNTPIPTFLIFSSLILLSLTVSIKRKSKKPEYLQ